MSETVSVRPTRFGGPAAYGSFAVERRISKIDEALKLNGLRVLDVGCGNGCYTIELASRSAWVCGVDIQLSHLKQFRADIPRLQAVGERLPFADESFDVVTMIEVLEHTVDDATVLGECHRVLRPGGQLVLFVPNKLYPMESHPCYLGKRPIGHNVPFVSWLPELLHRKMCPARIYSRSRLLRLCRQAGFRAKKMGYMFPPMDHFPLPFKNLYRRMSVLLERTPLRVLGVSIVAVLQRPLEKPRSAQPT